MTEEPESEDDVIFKGQNVECCGYLEYLIPVRNCYNQVLYLNRDELPVSYILRNSDYIDKFWEPT